jgi:hypothetical protein
MKSSQARVRLNQDNADTLRRLAEQSGMQPIEVASMLMHAALTAIRDSHGKVPFPVRFLVENADVDTRLWLQEKHGRPHK